MTYRSMHCRRCGSPIDPDLDVLKPGASSVAGWYDSCVYRCEPCGVGYSNARDEKSRRQITRTAELNVPAEVRGGLDEVLDGAINARNRPMKRKKFCSESSEDAVTWTVFRGLQQQGDLARAVPHDLPQPVGEPNLVLWGVAAGGPQAKQVADTLIDVSDRLRERPQSRSEPDVIVAWPELLLIAEAKLGSANDLQHDPSKFKRYLDPDLFAAPLDQVAELGYYELARNWRIGNDLTVPLRIPRFVLLNLGPAALASDVKSFAAQIRQTAHRQFRHRTWKELIEPRVQGWLREYAESRGLL